MTAYITGRQASEVQTQGYLGLGYAQAQSLLGERKLGGGLGTMGNRGNTTRKVCVGSRLCSDWGAVTSQVAAWWLESWVCGRFRVFKYEM